MKQSRYMPHEAGAPPGARPAWKTTEGMGTALACATGGLCMAGVAPLLHGCEGLLLVELGV